MYLRAPIAAHCSTPHTPLPRRQVTDLGAVLHLIGGTAAAYMIFMLPGLLCWNAAVIKATAGPAGSFANLAAAAEEALRGGGGGGGSRASPSLGLGS